MGTSQETKEDSQISVDTNDISRASFLTQVGRIASASLFGLSPVVTAFSQKIEIKIHNDPELNNRLDSIIDAFAEVKGIPVFRIIGVSHSDEDYKLHSTYLEKVIAESDAILYENPISENQYFGRVAKTASEQGKKTIPIDASNPYFRAAWCGLANRAGFAVAVSDFIQLIKQETPKDLSRRQVLTKGLVRAAVLSQVFEGPLTYVTYASDFYYPHRDISYVVDGRTVFMLHNILDLLKESNGEKITVVVGALHARGFMYYLSSENRDEYERKLNIYSKTPWRLISRMPEKL